jgi:hypothetical protein
MSEDEATAAGNPTGGIPPQVPLLWKSSGANARPSRAIGMATRVSATSNDPMSEPSQPRTQQALETGGDQSLGNSSIRGSWSEDQQLQRRQQSRQQQLVATATGPETTGETNNHAATAPRATSSMPTEEVGTATRNESDRAAAVEAARHPPRSQELGR